MRFQPLDRKFAGLHKDNYIMWRYVRLLTACLGLTWTSGCCRQQCAMQGTDAAAEGLASPHREKDMPTATDRDAALRIAEKAARADLDNQGVGGGELLWDRADVELQPRDASRGIVADRWYIKVPEQNPHTRPNGRELTVDVATGACAVVALE